MHSVGILHGCTLRDHIPGGFLQIVCLTDLENDFINPFDLSSKMNRFVVRGGAAGASRSHWYTGTALPNLQD